MASVVALSPNKLDQQSLESPVSLYPEGPAEEWLGDEDTLRKHAISVCENAWALVYTPLIDGPKASRRAA